MNDLSNAVINSLIYNYQDFGQRVNALAKPLTEEQFWTKPYQYGNSFGNLVLHLTGNLNYYIGSQIAHTGYIRDRELEFSASYIGQKDRVIKNLNDAVEMVIGTLKKQNASDWIQPYSATGVDDVKDRLSIFVRCAVHFHHHIGQMIYLVKELTKTS